MTFSSFLDYIYKMKIKAKLLTPSAHRVAWFWRKETWWDSFTCCVCVVSSVECDTFLSDDLNHSQWDAVADRTLIMTTLIFSARRDIFRRRNLYFIFHFTFGYIFTFYNLATVVYFRIFYENHFVHFQMSTRHFPTVKWALSEAKTWRNITISMRRSAGEWKAGEKEVDVDLFAVLHGANSNWWISDYGDFYRGKFGTVFKCKEKSSRQLLAAKFIAVPNRKERKNVEREIDMMNRLQHPKIIQLYDAFEYNKMVCVVLELWVGFSTAVESLFSCCWTFF